MPKYFNCNHNKNIIPLTEPESDSSECLAEWEMEIYAFHFFCTVPFCVTTKRTAWWLIDTPSIDIFMGKEAQGQPPLKPALLLGSSNWKETLPLHRHQWNPKKLSNWNFIKPWILIDSEMDLLRRHTLTINKMRRVVGEIPVLESHLNLVIIRRKYNLIIITSDMTHTLIVIFAHERIQFPAPPTQQNISFIPIEFFRTQESEIMKRKHTTRIKSFAHYSQYWSINIKRIIVTESLPWYPTHDLNSSNTQFKAMLEMKRILKCVILSNFFIQEKVRCSFFYASFPQCGESGVCRLSEETIHWWPAYIILVDLGKSSDIIRYNKHPPTAAVKYNVVFFFAIFFEDFKLDAYCFYFGTLIQFGDSLQNIVGIHILMAIRLQHGGWIQATIRKSTFI